MRHVRVCQICGQTNLADDSERCSNCWSLSGQSYLSESEGEEFARRRRLRASRGRLLRLSLIAASVFGLALWWAEATFDVGRLVFLPAKASTSWSPEVGPGVWAQGRRTPQSTGFTPDRAPHPRSVKWSYATQGQLSSSPAVIDEHVYLTTGDGRTVALNQETGGLIWEYSNESPSNSTPAIAGGLVIYALRRGRVIALDRETGDLRWETDLKSAVLVSPVVADGTVYIGAADNKVHAIDAATGKARWDFATDTWIIASVAYGDGVVLLTSQDHILHVLDAETGRRRLVYDAGKRRRIGGGAAVQGNMAYFGTRDGTAWGIDWRGVTRPFERGLLYWKTSLHLWGFLSDPPRQKGSVWSTGLGGEFAQTPAVDRDTVYITNREGTVFALEAATGGRRWVTDLEVGITAAPVAAGDTVLIGTEDGTVSGLDTSSGDVTWEFNTGGQIIGSPIVAGTTMYVVSGDGTLYAVTMTP